MNQQPYPLGTSDPEPEPHHHYEVHCGKCKWWGWNKQLRRTNTSDPTDGIARAACPICLSDQYLEYREDL
ncbi:hypothetical protein LCGC14_2511050 [marine sediment metagenome]|uniref:Uncharacterized protein n=1 Tax=marine sediment metagenome TaxID=412755 RepID=A0A0F9DAV9_9ZZZZ